MEHTKQHEDRQAKNRDFTLVENFIIDDIALSPHEFRVYVVLLRHDFRMKKNKKRKGTAFPSLRTIKRKARMSNRKIYDALDVLCASGLITITRLTKTRKDGSEGKLTRNVYSLIEPNQDDTDAINERIRHHRGLRRGRDSSPGVPSTVPKRHKRSHCGNTSPKSVPTMGTISVPTAGTEEDVFNKNPAQGKKDTPLPPFTGGCRSASKNSSNVTDGVTSDVAPPTENDEAVTEPRKRRRGELLTLIPGYRPWTDIMETKVYGNGSLAGGCAS